MPLGFPTITEKMGILRQQAWRTSGHGKAKCPDQDQFDGIFTCIYVTRISEVPKDRKQLHGVIFQSFTKEIGPVTRVGSADNHSRNPRTRP